MRPNDILEYCLDSLPDTVLVSSLGENGIFYNYANGYDIAPPVCAWMSWVCALNPPDITFERLKPLIQEAYEYAKEKYSKRK